MATTTRNATELDLVIVGAGISGLQALSEGLAAGLNIVVLEKEPMPGGKWSGHGIYDCVQIQQHRDDFFLPGVPWPDGTPAHAARDDAVSAATRYMVEHNLQPHIQCRSEVVSAVFDEAAGKPAEAEAWLRAHDVVATVIEGSSAGLVLCCPRSRTRRGVGGRRRRVVAGGGRHRAVVSDFGRSPGL